MGRCALTRLRPTTLTLYLLRNIMFDSAIQNIQSCDPNTIGLVLGFIGAVIVTIFGLPPISLLNEGNYIEIQITPKMKRNMWISRFGLLLLALGFFLQLASVPIAK